MTTDHVMRVRILRGVQILNAGLYSILVTVTALVRVGFGNPRSMVVRFHRRHKINNEVGERLVTQEESSS